jgi:hypothetical protein
VVLEELYAGAARSDYRIIEKLERDFERARRVLVPSLGDWAQAGRVWEGSGRSMVTSRLAGLA